MSTPRRIAHRVYGRMPEGAKRRVKDMYTGVLGFEQLHENQGRLALRLAELEKRVEPERLKVDEVADPRFPDYVRSRLCTAAAWEEPFFEKWCAELGVPATRHRKTWEFAYILEMLDRTGMLAPGNRGVGFGVGREPLVSLFATRGIEVLATDLDPSDREAEGWLRTGQHASGDEDDLRTSIVSAEDFKRLVTWRAADMRDIPKDITDYDFTWSTCALEHLGTLQLGLDFVRHSIETLRPGGIAVHTTEFNVDSNDATVETGPCVVYRERDLIAFKEEMEAAGHEVAAFDFNRGEGVLDHYVDIPPYRDEPVLRFQFADYTLTSVGIVVRKKA